MLAYFAPQRNPRMANQYEEKLEIQITSVGGNDLAQDMELDDDEENFTNDMDDGNNDERDINIPVDLVYIL